MRRPNDPMDIDLTAAECIAFASSQHPDDVRGSYGERWTELSVYHLPDGRFVSESAGCSSFSGERRKAQRLASTSIDRVLKLFSDTDIGIAAAETAREWAEQHEEALDAAAMALTDAEALLHLYGPEGERKKGQPGYSGKLAEDFGIGESTARAAIQKGTGIKVPLAAVVPFLDRALLARVREMRHG